MTNKPIFRSACCNSEDDSTLYQSESLAELKPKTKSKKSSRTSTKKILSRREKLVTVKKANQALMKALNLMLQRNSSTTDAPCDI